MTQQLACTYAALLLADSGKTDVDSILAVTKAAKVTVSKGMASAFAGLLKDSNIDDILKSVSFGGGCSAAAAPAAAAGGAPAKAAAAAAPEPEEEDDDFGMGGLF